MKYAIRFLSVAAFFLMIEQTSFFITRHAAKNMLADKEQKEILMRLPPKSESDQIYLFSQKGFYYEIIFNYRNGTFRQSFMPKSCQTWKRSYDR